jgi:hypothetical protein
VLKIAPEISLLEKSGCHEVAGRLGKDTDVHGASPKRIVSPGKRPNFITKVRYYRGKLKAERGQDTRRNMTNRKEFWVKKEKEG